MESIYFCDYSNTFRTHPENHWICSVKNQNLVFDSWDRAGAKFTTEHKMVQLFADITICRNEHKNLKKQVVNYTEITKTPIYRTACIVKTGGSFGVQYWLDYQIKNRFSINTDGTKSYFIDKL